MTELKDKKLLSVDKSRSFYYICEKYCENAGFFPNIVFECDSTRAIEDLVSAGFGVCFHPAFSWGKPSGRDIAFVPIRGKFRRKIVVTLYDSEKDGVKKHFFDFLTNYIKNQMTVRWLHSQVWTFSLFCGIIYAEVLQRKTFQSRLKSALRRALRVLCHWRFRKNALASKHFCFMVEYTQKIAM